MVSLTFPQGKRFAFSIIDDTDVATVENVRPIYRLLEEMGMRTTKTVWPVGCPEGSRDFSSSQTLEDPEYRDFVLDLQRRGFEITWHGGTMESSTRERTVEALERFRATFGSYPRVHANHSYNRENLYWGAERIDQPLLRVLYRRMNGRPADHYQGHLQGSPYWWGDLCLQHFAYVRNLTFQEINLSRINPSMPYADPARPCARWWFSASDAEDREEFDALLSTENQERLEREGGVCIVATHLGKGFVHEGEVVRSTRERLEELAGREGWFVPVGELLDWLRAQRRVDFLPRSEWRRMQWRWARDLAVRQWRQRRRKKHARARRSALPSGAHSS
ncbi:hypothetical protein BH23GEM7_BH23GEM7_03990 [soil metagenome]